LRWLPFALLLATAACEVSPTALERLDPAGLERLVTRSGADGPAQRVLLDLVRRLGDPAAEPGALPGLDSLFVLSLAHNGADGPSAGEASQRLQHHQEIAQRAWAAIDQGDRDTGEDGLQDARAYQAETVVQALGPGMPFVYVSIAGRTLDRLSAADGGEDATRAAIARTATDLLADAREALQRGHGAVALDLATHAAGLINLLRSGPTPH
jgi:hypothetical protein